MAIIQCSKCPATADLYKDPASINGWQVIPAYICGDCIETEMKARPTHQMVEMESHFRGKVIRTLSLVQIEVGRQA